MSSIDRVDWHYGNDYPLDLPQENAGTHIGMYLNWIIDSGLIGEFHIKESSEGIKRINDGKITGRDFLFEYCDGKFWNEELNQIGIEFTESYYSSNQYFEDYTRILVGDLESIYEVEDSLENYKSIKFNLDSRFKKWNNRKNKKNWEFWK